MTRITRVEIITDTGRDYVCWEEDNDITVSYQDDGRTLKVFVNTVKPKSPAEKAYYAVYGAYPPTTPSVSNYEDNRWKDFQNGYNASKVSETPQERGERVHKETEELITKIHDGHRVVEYQPIPQEPEELKTLYQLFYENDWNVRSCEVFCDIVKEWMSQYADNVMCGEYKKGYEYCLTVLEENLK